MVHTGNRWASLSILGSVLASEVTIQTRQSDDPCAKVVGKKWVDPAVLRACFTSVPVDPDLKENIIDVINKTLLFHTSVNYQISAPEPFTNDVHEDLVKDLARISDQSYDSEFDLHLLCTSHYVIGWILLKLISLQDAVYINFLPIPLVQLTDTYGAQTINIAPEAYKVASAEFADQISVWEAALPDGISLESLDGATVLSINGEDPLAAVDQNAEATGGFEGLGTRQNSFFSSYQQGWTYLMGDFAQQNLPLSDSATLQVQRVNQSLADTITLPYRARIGPNTMIDVTDTDTWRSGLCIAFTDDSVTDNSVDSYPDTPTIRRVTKQFMPRLAGSASSNSPSSKSKRGVNVMHDQALVSNVVFPPSLTPPSQNISGNSAQSEFFMLDDGITGVLALGSFSGEADLQRALLHGLMGLKSKGAKQLIVDLTNNGGGVMCTAAWLHRILAGPKKTTEPQAILDTKLRANPLAQLILKAIIHNNTDPDGQSAYNPIHFTNADNVPFATDFDYMDPAVKEMINEHEDAFSQRLGSECPPINWPAPPPDEALFEGNKVVLVSNGRCASSCALFAVTMAKEEGAKTVVLGGRKSIQQQYCGTVGGESTNGFSFYDEAKAAGLKDHPLNQPILKVQGIVGLTWRLAFGVEDPTQPEEWQDHPADLNMPLTAEIVNNPLAIWNEVVKQMF
ncbi:hypothetical protein D9758_009178 [Tetrapyrgos nigripes]|uniref:Tail specific protease domain-containing protein n=1 Tax=Tetrapyrgos nigripes TaxID=182062 RepID=A0A8H5LK86_9AGAR|nr:hypothetical protein D9758_009178 [Tetrapyrgos nigripes]